MASSFETRPGSAPATGLVTGHTRRRTWLALLPAWGLAACATRDEAAPAGERLRQGVALARGLPEQLPDKSSPFPHAQFVLIAAENPVELLNPIPFVADLVTDAVHQSAAAAFEARYASIHPFLQAQAALRGSAVLATRETPYKLQPFVVVQECLDDRYRLALVFHVQGPDWQTRYLAHLPTAHPRGAFKAPTPALLQAVGRELAAGAQGLRGLLERDQRGSLRGSGARAKVGSLHLVGNRALGVISAQRMLAEAEIVDDSSDALVLRMAGDMTAPASSGGLFFGVHLMRRDQLHTFERL